MDRLVLKNVTKAIRSKVILDNVTLTAESGKIYGFSGKNGSGKTMLFRAVAGLLHIDSGEICIFGKRMGKDISFPESMGLTIENVGFWPHLTGLQCMEALRKIKKVAPAIASEKALERVGLNPADTRKYAQYSLGMKQKLAIAQAIMEKPRLLIFDEPSNSLDESSTERLACILREERERGALILLSSHDSEYLSSLCDTIYHIADGKLQEH